MNIFYRKLSNFKLGLVGLIASLSVVACNNKDHGTTPTVAQTIMGYQALSQFELLTIKNNYVVTLSNRNTASGSNGDFTVFVPTNEAFAKIGIKQAGDVNLLQPAFIQQLFLYHINNGNVSKDLLIGGAEVSSLLSQNLKKRIIVKNDSLYINGSKIISANIKADNGTVHVVNRVMMAVNANLYGAIKEFASAKVFVKPELQIFSEALAYTGLDAELADAKNNFTIFAPTDLAFENLGRQLGISVGKPADIHKIDKNTLTQILRSNFLGQPAFTSVLKTGGVTANSSTPLSLTDLGNGYFTIKSNQATANMLISDIQTLNGVIHITDAVLR
ncbi:fasciclin domain-containing protein [Pelobium manganitolerans]|uniref:fasciclin domain-containing protein n=1 Tax=Pelobium manganitolerans TaxID=1842495 RepID=UPI003FA345B9